ncbi:MAG: hypothetical protein JWM96_1346 [Alphaproteobacteria bacterium]|nr:hypothetical protein [Alphaproteobacteria bacterium]
MSTSRSSGDPALLIALESVLREQELVERELAELHARLAHLREASSGLVGLLGAAEAQKVADAVGVPLRLRPTPRVQDEQRRLRNERVHAAKVVSGQGQSNIDPARPDGTEPFRTPASAPAIDAGSYALSTTAALDSPASTDGTSTDKVVQLLREFNGRAIPRQMIVDEFFRRGWNDEGWKEPEAAIRMAINRAVARGEAQQVNGGRYMHKTPDLFQGDSSEGGEA